MPDANTIALVSVVVTGTTAVLAPTVAGWREAKREQRRFKHEREVSDVIELRALLDEAASTLADALANLTVEGTRSEDARFKTLLEHRQTLWRLSGRIALRLGSDHPVFRDCEACATRIEGLVRLLDPGVEEVDNLEDRIVSEYEDFERAREDFYDASQRVVGAAIEHDAEGLAERSLSGDLTWRERFEQWRSDRKYARDVKRYRG